jgi:hypothetical protein
MGEAEDKKFARLCRAADESYEVLDYSRRVFKQNVKLMVGQHFAEDGSDAPVPDNKFALLESVLKPLLAGQKPSVEVTTQDPDRRLQRTAKAFEAAFPIRLDQVRYEEMQDGCLSSSLFSPFGICEVGRRVDKVVKDEDGEPVTYTDPTVEETLFEDFVYDAQAKRYGDAQFAGSCTDANLEAFLDHNTDIKPEIRDKIVAENQRDGGVVDEGRTSDISGQPSRHTTRYIETFRVWKIWCRDAGEIKLVYAPGALRNGILLKTLPYTAREEGPYHFLHYHDVPGQILKLSPAAVLRDAFEAINLGWNKAIAQAEDQKSVYGFRDPDVANLIRTLADGHTFQSQSPNEFARIDLGGAHQSNVGIAQVFSNVFEQSGYPLGLLGGLSHQSPTATQDAILQGNAGKLIQNMAYRKHRFDQGIVEQMAADMWDDERFAPEGLRHYPRGGIRAMVDLDFAPEQRYGEFPKYKIAVLPYSTMVLSPQQKWAQAIQFIQTTLLPAAGLMAQQGNYINWTEIISGYAKANGISHEMGKAIIMGMRDSTMLQAGGGSNAPTERNYRRISESSGNNPQARAMEQASMLMSGANGNQGGGQGAY